LVNNQPATNMTVVSGNGLFVSFSAAPGGNGDGGVCCRAWNQGHIACCESVRGRKLELYTRHHVVVSENVRLNELVAATRAAWRMRRAAEDWVEIYNLSTNLVSIAGWSLSDAASTPDKWVFPAVTIPANGFLVVFCSGKDRKPTAPGRRCTPISSWSPDGEFLGLYNSATPRRLISSFNPYPNQRHDYSYGYDAWGNCDIYGADAGLRESFEFNRWIVADTKFNHDRGFYTNGFSLTITCATPGVTIRYTRDGSAPSPNNGLIYSTPLVVTKHIGGPRVSSKSGLLDSDTDCQSYLFLDDIIISPTKRLRVRAGPRRKRRPVRGR